jgi:hypothetical protein
MKYPGIAELNSRPAGNRRSEDVRHNVVGCNIEGRLPPVYPTRAVDSQHHARQEHVRLSLTKTYTSVVLFEKRKGNYREDESVGLHDRKALVPVSRYKPLVRQTRRNTAEGNS